MNSIPLTQRVEEVLSAAELVLKVLEDTGRWETVSATRPSAFANC